MEGDIKSLHSDPADQARARRALRRVFAPRADDLPPDPPEACPVPRVALTREEAAAAIGVSLDSFERHVQPELPVIRRGKLRLIAVAELERWSAEAGEPIPR